MHFTFLLPSFNGSIEWSDQWHTLVVLYHSVTISHMRSVHSRLEWWWIKCKVCQMFVVSRTPLACCTLLLNSIATLLVCSHWRVKVSIVDRNCLCCYPHSWWTPHHCHQFAPWGLRTDSSLNCVQLHIQCQNTQWIQWPNVEPLVGCSNVEGEHLGLVYLTNLQDSIVSCIEVAHAQGLGAMIENVQ